MHMMSKAILAKINDRMNEKISNIIAKEITEHTHSSLTIFLFFLNFNSNNTLREDPKMN